MITSTVNVYVNLTKSDLYCNLQLGPKKHVFLLGWHCNKHHFCVNSWRRINFFMEPAHKLEGVGNVHLAHALFVRFPLIFFKLFSLQVFQALVTWIDEGFWEYARKCCCHLIWSVGWAIWANICLGKWCVSSGKCQKHVSGQTLFLQSLFHYVHRKVW